MKRTLLTILGTISPVLAEDGVRFTLTDAENAKYSISRLETKNILSDTITTFNITTKDNSNLGTYKLKLSPLKEGRTNEYSKLTIPTQAAKPCMLISCLNFGADLYDIAIDPINPPFNVEMNVVRDENNKLVRTMRYLSTTQNDRVLCYGEFQGEYKKSSLVISTYFATPLNPNWKCTIKDLRKNESVEFTPSSSSVNSELVKRLGIVVSQNRTLNPISTRFDLDEKIFTLVLKKPTTFNEVEYETDKIKVITEGTSDASIITITGEDN